MSAVDRNEAVEAAAAWLTEQTDTPSPVVPILRQRFGISAREAIDAIRLRQNMEASR